MRWPFCRRTETVVEFARPLGRPSAAARLPWRLPDEPALAGIAADTAAVGRLTVRAASLVGAGHRCEEPALPRQDAYRLGLDKARRHLIVAVADGMSDAKLAHIGAHVAVTALAAGLRTALDHDGPPNAARLFLDAARQMSAVAEQRGVTEHDVRAAALAAVIPIDPGEFGRRTAWVATLADVSAWVRAASGWRRLAGDGKDGLDRGRLTHFLPFHPDEAAGVTVVLEAGAVLALATDGLGDALAGGGLASWFADRWQRPPHITAFVGDVGFEAPGWLDDRTAVVVWCGS